MKNNYFFGVLLAIIFPGLIQLYTGEKSKSVKYVFYYLLSFLIIFILLTVSGYKIDTSDLNQVLNDSLLINISFVINVVFRLLSGIDGLLQIHKIRKNLY